MRIHVEHDSVLQRPPLRAVLADFRPHRRVALIGCTGVALMTASLAALPIVTWVLENHDVTRIVTRFGGERQARAAALLLLALPGPVFVLRNFSKAHGVICGRLLLVSFKAPEDSPALVISQNPDRSCASKGLFEAAGDLPFC